MARARVLDLRQKVKSKHAQPWAVRWSVRRAGRRSFHEQRFRTQAEALRFCDDLNVKLSRGHHPQLRDGRRLFEEYAQAWLASLHDVAPRTRQGYETLFRVHVFPAFGGRQLRDIRRSDLCRRWEPKQPGHPKCRRMAPTHYLIHRTTSRPAMCGF